MQRCKSGGKNDETWQLVAFRSLHVSGATNQVRYESNGNIGILVGKHSQAKTGNTWTKWWRNINKNRLRSVLTSKLDSKSTVMGSCSFNLHDCWSNNSRNTHRSETDFFENASNKTSQSHINTWFHRFKAQVSMPAQGISIFLSAKSSIPIHDHCHMPDSCSPFATRSPWKIKHVFSRVSIIHTVADRQERIW